MFDGVVSARVWRPGEPFPPPAVSGVDDTYRSGFAGIGVQDLDWWCPRSTGRSVIDAAAAFRFVQASSAPLTHSGRGDLDADGVVDGNDLAIVLDAWGPCAREAGGCVADVNDDGVVDAGDLAIVVGNWG